MNPTRPGGRRGGPADPAEDVLGPAEEYELDQGDDELTVRLRSLLDADHDLRGRTSADVERTLRGRSLLATGLELLGLGWWTTRALLSDEVGPADEEQEGT